MVRFGAWPGGGKAGSGAGALLLAGLLGMLLLTALWPARLAAAAQADRLETVRLQLKWRHQFQFAGYYAAQEKGFFRAEGLDVTLVEGRPRLIPSAILERGEADFAVDSPGVMAHRQAGRKVVVLAAIFQHSPAVVLARNGSGIASLGDLRGKTVMASPDMDPELLAMLASEGLPPDSLVFTPHSWSVDDLLHGSVDAQTGYLTNEAQQLRRRGADPVVIHPRTHSREYYGDCLLTTEKLARERPDLAERFLRAALRGWSYALENPREIAALILARHSQDKPMDDLLQEAEAMREFIQPELVELGHMNPERWRRMAALFEKAGVLKPGFRVEDMLYDEVRGDELARHNRLLTLGAGVLGVLLFLGCGIGAGLLAFNRRLSDKVRERTAALSESRDQYRLLVEQQFDPVVRLDGSGRLLYASPHSCRVFGKTEAEILGQSFASFVHEDDRAATFEAIGSLAAPPHTGSVEHRCLTAEGLRWYSWTGTGLLAPDGSMAEVVAVGRDITERRRAEEALRQSERRFRSLFDTMAEGVALHILVRDEAGRAVNYRILDVNPSCCRILGLKEEALLQRLATEAYGVAEAPYLDRYAQVAESGQALSFETYYPGLGRHFDISVAPWGADGFATIFSDITQRKLAEQELRAKTEELELYFANTLDLLCIADTDGYFRRLNPEWEAVLGYPLAELEGRRFLDFVHPDDLEPTLSVLRNLAGQDKVMCFVNRYRARDGGYRWIEWRGFPVGKTIFASARDITASRQAEEALRESEAQYRGIFEQAAVGICHCSLDGVFSRVNRRMAEILGYGEDELLRMNFRDITHPDDLDEDLGHVRKVLAGLATGFEMEKRYIRKDRLVIWVHLSVSVVTGREGQPLYFVGVIEDITASRSAMAEMAKARALAEDANRSKSEFLANMSHEIRTPLNGVLGMLQLLKSTPMDVEQGGYVDKAHDAARRLLALLSDILDFSRIEAGKLSLRVAPFALRDVFDMAATMLGGAAMKKGVALRMGIDESVPGLLLGDDARIRQVLLNLVGNAVKFTASGSVRVQAWARPGRPGGGVWLYVSVTDTGVGIPEDKLASVFERFIQSDGSYSRQYEGAGLGLTIVRRIIDLMDGDICVESEMGQGTTMLFSLPLLPASKSEPQPQRRRIEEPGGQNVEPLRILLAEDETISQFAMRVMLQRMGHTVMAVGNGRAALDEFRAGSYDAILMDIQMPEMNGVEATQAIRGDERLGERAQVPIIALTAYAMVGDREKFLAAGMTDYVTKPVSQSELQRALGQVRRKT